MGEATGGEVGEATGGEATGGEVGVGLVPPPQSLEAQMVGYAATIMSQDVWHQEWGM